jgi:hypothetical protein
MMRRIITFKKCLKGAQSNSVEGTAAELLGYVWPLTEELCSFGDKYNAKQRLQRDVVRIKRRKG